MFVDASVIVAILNEEPGFEELEKRLDVSGGKFYVTPLVRFEAISALVRLRIEAKKGKLDRTEAFNSARQIVDDFLEVLGVREITIGTSIGNGALDALALYGKVAGHPAALNFGDCFAYAAAKAYRIPLLYKGNDFSHTDLA